MKFLSKLFDLLFGWMSPKIELDDTTTNTVVEVANPIASNEAPVAESAPKKPRKPRAKKAKPELRVEE